MATLRAPDGCPWDREQTIDSLRPFVLEETYEVLEAIDRHDHEALLRGARRLPVRGGVPRPARGRGRPLHHRRRGARASPTSWCGGIRTSSRATRANRRSTRPTGARAVGGDQGGGAAGAAREAEDAAQRRPAALPGAAARLPDRQPRRLGRLRLGQGRRRASTRSRRRSTNSARWWPPAAIDRERAEEEMGDLLFAIANLSRKLGIEPETALRKANDKFAARFTAMETRIADRGRQMHQLTFDERDAEWNTVKSLRDDLTASGHENSKARKSTQLAGHAQFERLLITKPRRSRSFTMTSSCQGSLATVRHRPRHHRAHECDQPACGRRSEDSAKHNLQSNSVCVSPSPLIASGRLRRPLVAHVSIDDLVTSDDTCRHHNTTRRIPCFKSADIEVHDKRDWRTSQPQIADHLSDVDRMQLLDRLDFQHELSAQRTDPLAGDRAAVRDSARAAASPLRTESLCRAARYRRPWCKRLRSFRVRVRDGPQMQQPIVFRTRCFSLGRAEVVTVLLSVMASCPSCPSCLRDKQARRPGPCPAQERAYLQAVAVGVDGHRAVLVGAEDLRAHRFVARHAPPARGGRRRCRGRR